MTLRRHPHTLPTAYDFFSQYEGTTPHAAQLYGDVHSSSSPLHAIAVRRVAASCRQGVQRSRRAPTHWPQALRHAAHSAKRCISSFPPRARIPFVEERLVLLLVVGRGAAAARAAHDAKKARRRRERVRHRAVGGGLAQGQSRWRRHVALSSCVGFSACAPLS